MRQMDNLRSTPRPASKAVRTGHHFCTLGITGEYRFGKIITPRGPSPAEPSPAWPNGPGDHLNALNRAFEDGHQGRPPRAANARSGQPEAGRRHRTTPERCPTPYNSVSGSSIVIFWHTGTHLEITTLVTFSPLEVAQRPLGEGVFRTERDGNG